MLEWTRLLHWHQSFWTYVFWSHLQLTTVGSSKMDHNVWVGQPKCSTFGDLGKALKCLKALYGKKQGARFWWMRFDEQWDQWVLYQASVIRVFTSFDVDQTLVEGYITLATMQHDLIMETSLECIFPQHCLLQRYKHVAERGSASTYLSQDIVPMSFRIHSGNNVSTTMYFQPQRQCLTTLIATVIETQNFCNTHSPKSDNPCNIVKLNFPWVTSLIQFLSQNSQHFFLRGQVQKCVSHCCWNNWAVSWTI